MNPRRRALLAVGLAVLIVSAGSIQGHETYAFDSAEREATLLETTNAFRARSEPVVVRFCPPVSSIANCSDCPDHFEVEPCVTSVTDLAQFSCTVCYDDAVFEVSKVLASGLTQDCQLDWSETSGCVSFTGNCEPGVNGLGPIAKISFVRRGTAFPSWLNWARAELRDSRGQSIASSTEPGCVSSDCIPGDVWRSCDCKIDVADVLWCVVDWLQPFLDTNIFLVGFGGIFMLVGAAVGSFIVRDDLPFGLLFGGIFFLVGGLIFALGVWNLFKEIG